MACVPGQGDEGYRENPPPLPADTRNDGPPAIGDHSTIDGATNAASLDAQSDAYQ